jgi:hypothetical protein
MRDNLSPQRSGRGGRRHEHEFVAASSWTLDEGGILFLGFEEGKLHPKRLDLESKALSPLGLLDADPAGGLALDPERKRLLFTRVVRSESDLVLARLP